MPQRTLRALAAGSVVTALGAGVLAAVPASAAELDTTPETVASSSFSSVPAAATPSFARAQADFTAARAAGPDITYVRVASPSVIYQQGLNYQNARVGYTGSVSSVTAKATINGKPSPGVAYLRPESAALKANIGIGSVQLGPLTVNGNVTDSTKSNVFSVRKAAKGTIKVERTGSSKTRRFYVSGHVYEPTQGKYVSIGAINVQYKSGSTWKTLKRVPLNSAGKGYYTRSLSSSYSYRISITTTKWVQGGVSDGTPKI